MARASIKVIDRKILDLRGKARLVLEEIDKLNDEPATEHFETLRLLQLEWVELMIEIMSLRAIKWHINNMSS